MEKAGDRAKLLHDYRVLLLEINSVVIPASHGGCMVFLHE
jgi:hypothetical protein